MFLNEKPVNIQRWLLCTPTQISMLHQIEGSIEETDWGGFSFFRGFRASGGRVPECRV